MFKPEMEIVLFAAQDIVTTSGEGSGNENAGDPDWE